jgi:opacity protein-like surface antigen
MMRIARVATMLLVVTGGGAAAQAQATAATDSGWYGEFNVGATLGHTSDKSIGAEAGLRISEELDLFVEGGHIGNAATTDFEQRGQRIANAVGAGLSSIERVNYFDVGLRYHIPATPMVHPYVGVGVGFAHITTETNLSVNGTVVPPESLGVQLGNDLAGTFNKPFIMIGGGANINFGTRYFIDLSYRFGRASGESNSDVILAGVSTQRAQVGIGARF